jgi:hypothetical protein
MGQYDLRSSASAFNRGLRDALHQQEVARQQAFWNELEASSKMAAMARAENEQRRQAALDAIAAEDRQRRIQREDAEASAGANARGLRQMEADALRQGVNPRDVALQAYGETGEVPSFLADALKPAPEPRRTIVTTTGPDGRPVRRAVTEDELITGVPEYREPREPRQPNYTWVLRDGKAMHIREEQIAPGDVPYQPSSGNGAGTEGQRRTEGLLSRAQAARQTIDSLEPSIGGWDTLAPVSWLQSSNGQQYGQAARQWIQSVLRDESGAAIGADEEASYFRTYFRQPGDSAAVIQQKQRARSAAESAMLQKVGTSRNSGSNASPRVRRYNPATGRLQ